MAGLAKPQSACNIAESLERQLRHLFGADSEDGEDIAILLHGSILDAERWRGPEEGSDIDLLVLSPDLSRRKLDGIYSRLAYVRLLDRPVALETRVGPVPQDPDGASAPAGVTLHVTVVEGPGQLSPVTLQVLEFASRTVVGTAPGFDSPIADERGLAEAFAADVATFGEMLEGGLLPYWQWSEDEPLRRVQGRVPARSPAARDKLRKYVRTRLYGWSLLATRRAIASIAGLSPSDMLDLAGRVDEPEVFLALSRGS